jgi:hypothetical protein
MRNRRKHQVTLSTTTQRLVASSIDNARLSKVGIGAGVGPGTVLDMGRGDVLWVGMFPGAATQEARLIRAVSATTATRELWKKRRDIPPIVAAMFLGAP